MADHTTTLNALRYPDIDDGPADGPLAVEKLAEDTDAVLGDRRAIIIPGAETRTNVAYGYLATPDKIPNVVIPDAKCIVRIAYQATWKESVLLAAKAAIFIGASQLDSPGENAPGVSAEAVIGGVSGGVGHYVPFGTILTGLNGTSSGDATDYPGDATTGQTFGGAGGTGGVCEAFIIAPGTYDIGVQFKASSGDVTAKNRRLYVQVVRHR